MNKLIIRFVLLLHPIYNRLQVDTRQLAILLHTKLLMDDRRPLNTFGNRAKKENNYSSWINMLLLGIMGCVLLFFLVLINKPYLSYTSYFGAFMAMLCLTLIADFSVILLDERDQYVVLPRPVNDVTFTLARIVHIGISMGKQVVGLALPGWVYTWLVKGWLAMFIFVWQVLIATIICVLLVNLFYLVMMRWLSVQRFKDLVAYLQIAFSILIFAMYYTVPGLLQSALVQQLDFKSTHWLWVMPASWIAAWQEVGKGDFSLLAITLSISAWLLPVLAFVFIVRRFSKGFHAALAGMSVGGRNIQAGGALPSTSSWANRCAAWFTREPIENAGFKFVWMITGRTREFKTKVYPSMAYVPVYCGFLLFFRNNGPEKLNLEERWQQVLDQHTYLFVLYFSLLTLLTVFQFITQSERYKAAWVYFITPIDRPGLLMSGVLKAAFVKFYLPFMFVFTVLGISFIGISVLNDILLSTAVGGIAAILICLLTVNGYPFSQPIKKAEGRFISNLLLMALIGLIGFGHYFAVEHELVVWGLAVFFCSVCAVMLHFFKKEKWEKIIFNE